MKKLTSLLIAILMVMTIIPASMLTASAAGVVPSKAKEYNGHTYYVYKTTSYSWKKAKAYCESKGGHLVTITSSKENKFVNSLLKNDGESYYSIGLYDKNADGNYKMAWVTGEKYKYKTWASGEPSIGSNKDCFYTTIQYEPGDANHGKWRLLTSDDEDIAGFICEWDMSKKAANSFRMKDSTASVYYGSTVTLKTLNASGTVKWKSSNTKIATVSSKGVVKGVALGTCTISATNGKKTVKCKVTVKDRASKATVSFKVNGGGYFIKGESTATVKFKMKSYNCAKVTVYIKNSSGENVYKKTFSKLKKGTYYSFTWNGKNTKDKYVPSGSYRVQVVSGSKKTYSKYLAFKSKNEFAGGNGSKSSPFLVASTSQLKKIVKYPTGYFKQTKNLDFDYTSVGNFFTVDQPFNGVYDGGKKTISNISANTALFNVIGEKGTVKNVVMKNCSVTGKNDTAILAKENYGKITNCNVNGSATVTMNLRADLDLGFMVWNNYGTITDCVVSGQASVKNTEYYRESWVGGIATANFEEGKIISCISHVNMTASSEGGGDSYIGGIVGYNKGLVNNCEADGTLDSNCSGGIVGYNVGQIMSSYYTGSSDVDIASYNSGIIA